MSSPNQHTAHTTNGTIGSTGAAFDAVSGSFVKMLEHNRHVFEKMVLALQEESLRFVNLRLEHTSKAIQNSRDCQGLTGLFGAQHEWLMDAARDYAAESQRVGDVMREIAAEGASEVTEAASSARRFTETGERAAA
jgi:hypothetical protein